MRHGYPWHEVEPISDLRDMFLKSCRKFSRNVALQSKVGGAWIPTTYAELEAHVRAFATGLMKMGLSEGDRVAIMSENRTAWPLAYLSVTCSGSVCVPIDRELREQEVFHILFQSEPKFVVVSAKYVEMMRDLKSRLPHVLTIIDMDDTKDEEDIKPLDAVLHVGRCSVDKGDDEFARRSVTPNHLAAIIFTSGTMGNSKGVMLSHKNLASNIMNTCMAVYVDDKDRVLSVLPLHHTYECTAGLLIPLYRGATISYCENLRRLAENMAETRSTLMLGVPLLYESIYRRIREGIAEGAELRFRLGKGIATFSQRLFGVNVRRQIFGEVHRRFGGSLRLMISGGAAIDPEVSKGFRELGFHLIQGYGLTEASPLVAVNRPKAFKDDAVGPPLPNVQVKIEDGEILVRGDNVMVGYYKNPQATADVIRDGWLYTGDLGYLDEDGYLHIQGRKKSVIVTQGGKKIYPEEIETELMRSPFILECLVWGGPDPVEPEVQAIVVPSIQQFDLHFAQRGEAPSTEKIELILRDEIRKRCSNLASFKRVKKFTIREEEFAKTTTKKVKRYLYTAEGPELNLIKV